MRIYLKLKRTHTDCNNSREIPTYILTFFVCLIKKSSNICRNFSGVVAVSVGSLQFQIDPRSSYTSRYLQAPSGVVGVTYRDFNLLHWSLLKWFPLFGFSLQVSSVSNFCPDTGGRRWSRVQVRWFSPAAGREGRRRHMSLVSVGSSHRVPATLGLPPPTGVCCGGGGGRGAADR